MAIIKGTYVTNLKGRVGDVVYRNRDGENVASQRPAYVSNPRTASQQIQRMKMRTVAGAYAALKSICDHSFQGVKYGSKSMGYFMKKNLAIVASGAENYALRQNYSLVPNGYLISEGTMQPSNFVMNTDGNSLRKPITLSGNSLANVTVEQFHNLLGINVGDEIAIVMVGVSTAGSVFQQGNVSQDLMVTQTLRLIFKNDATSRAKMAFSNEDAYFLPDPEVLDPESENANLASWNYINGYLNVGQNVDMPSFNTQGMVAGAVIFSRKVNSVWERSTQYLSVWPAFVKTQYALANVLPSYDPNANKYLNEAID